MIGPLPTNKTSLIKRYVCDLMSGPRLQAKSSFERALFDKKKVLSINFEPSFE